MRPSHGNVNASGATGSRGDLTRPQLHFTASSGWINDPLGLTYHDGRYHLFFQHVPGSSQWAREQHWGHATSTDLLHWIEHDPALSPGDGDDGVWSGSLAIPPEGGDPRLFYTSVSRTDDHIGRARIARPADQSWSAWRKGDVVAWLPEGLDVVAFRDPYVIHDGTSWLMLMGAGLVDGTAAALAFRSDDLEVWTYDGPLLSRHRSSSDPVWAGAAWECPQLLRLDERWVLIVSAWEPGTPHDQVYAVGDLVDGRFVPESWHQLSYGLCYYAGSAFTDAEGRRGLIHWLRGVNDVRGRWAGAHSVPHVLGLRGDRVVAHPHPNLSKARRGDVIPVRAGTARVGSLAELEWTTDRRARADLVLADGKGEIVRLKADENILTARTDTGASRLPLIGRDVRVLLDGPTLEVFTDAGVLATPIRAPGADCVAAFSGRGLVVGHHLMRSL